MPNDSLWDKLARKLYPRYLSAGQIGKINGKIYAGILHRSPDVQNPYWQVVQYVYLNSDTLLKYLGLASRLKVAGEVNRNDSIFEIVTPVLEKSAKGKISLNSGDTICVAPSDRQYIHPHLSQ